MQQDPTRTPESIVPPPPAPGAEAGPPDGFGARLAALFAAPGRLMTWVQASPRWLTAGLVIMAATGLFTSLTAHIAGPEQLEVMRETRFGEMMSAEQFQEQMARAEAPSVAKRVAQFVSGAAAAWIVTFIGGLVYLLFSKLAGGPGTFRQVMGVVFWSGIIASGLGSLVRLPLVLAKGSVMEVSTGLGVLVEPNPLALGYQVLGAFDLFTIWGLALIVIGFEKVHGFARVKAIAVTVLPWALMTAVMLGIGRLFI